MSRSRPIRTSRRYDTEPPARVLGRGLFVVAIIAALAWLATTFYSGVPLRDYEMVRAELPRIGSLLEKDPVRMGGVRVGLVKSIGRGPRGGSELVLQLEPGTDVPSDTDVRVRANGLLGARFVELVPGRSRTPLASGAVLRGDDESLTFGATDALDTFDRETRGALRPLLGELGDGLAGRGRDVNDTLRIGAREIGPTTRLFGELRASGPAVRRLLPSLADGMAPLDANRAALTALLPAGTRAVQPFVAERDAVRDGLDVAPSALGEGDTALTTSRPLLTAAGALSREIRTTLPGTAGGLRAATALLRESHTPLERTRVLLDRVEPAVPAVLRTTRALSPLVGPLADMLGDLVPVARKLGPYGCDLKNFGAVFRSMTGLGTRAGGGPNGPAMQFRLQAAAPVPTELLSLKDFTGMVVRDGYPDPCEYLAKPYPIIERPASLGGGR